MSPLLLRGKPNKASLRGRWLILIIREVTEGLIPLLEVVLSVWDLKENSS